MILSDVGMTSLSYLVCHFNGRTCLLKVVTTGMVNNEIIEVIFYFQDFSVVIRAI